MNTPKKGRGAQFNTQNRFLSSYIDYNNTYYLDEEREPHPKTQLFFENAKHILNPVKSPDVPGDYSMNPYQGCEHGCIYCYARNSHEYWGFSAGTDFEQKIIIKQNAAQLLEKELQKKNHKVSPILLSGNTDCYQPLEKKYEITRSLLKVLLQYKHPVSIITKNALILRDLDLLKPLAELNLLHVMITVTTLSNELRACMEPRTSTSLNRINAIKVLNNCNIPAGLMMAPIIPGLNSHEIPEMLRLASDAGARTAAYTILRLNGQLEPLFINWIQTNYPGKAEKVLGQIREAHGGRLSDNRFYTRMRGEGKLVESISRLFRLYKLRYFKNRSFPLQDSRLFCPPGQQLHLF